jgi:hypothetical protein
MKEKYDPHRALGWMMTIAGKSMEQHKSLFDKERLFATAIHGSRMRRQYAPIAYNCYYISSIGYTMTSIKNSLNQCKSIKSPIICTTLNKVGIHINISLDQKAWAELNPCNTSLATSLAMMVMAT